MKSTCRNLLLIVLLALGQLSGAGLRAAPTDIDRIVAVVNNSVITDHEWQKRVQQTLDQLSKQNTPLPPRRLLERQVLERMITERILLQMAADTNIRIDGPQLDRALSRIAGENDMNLEQFRKALEDQGIDYDDFREQIRNEMTIARLREREVDNRIVVTDAEIDNYLANPGTDADKQTEYKLAHILILAPEGASPEELQRLKAKADNVMAELKSGADFNQVSATYSDAQNALEGGRLDWRTEAQLPTLFANAVRGLNPGELTPVLRSANGFHILKLLDKRGKDVKLVVKQTHARHILIKTNEVVSEDDARRRLAGLRERIVAGADFAELARLNSEDGTAARGGDLGWVYPGDTVPEFERAMNALAPGEISQPVRTPFGFHLIQVLERRSADVSAERQRQQARLALRERKADEAYQEWLRQLRDRTYVELRLDER
jgi:peptidyl-prolyl cis-trans isomerase SurA